MHVDQGPYRPSLSWRTHCVACGSKKDKRWGEGRTSLAKFCPNKVCSLHGIPHLVAVKTVVTIDRLGRSHVSHREAAVRRRPTFTPDSVPA